MELKEGEGSSEMEFTDIETTAEFLDGSVIFHVVKDAIGFVLYMHQQIPSYVLSLTPSFPFTLLANPNRTPKIWNFSIFFSMESATLKVSLNVFFFF